MKNLLFTFIIASLAFGCSEESAPVSPSVVESHIFIDGQRFEPSAATDLMSFVTTSFEAGVVNGTANRRTFELSNTTGTLATEKNMTVVITYPLADNISGTYEFAPAVFDPADDVQASFANGNEFYGFTEGAIIVSDLGNNKYRLSFTNAKMVNISAQDTEIPVSGYFEGIFSEE